LKLVRRVLQRIVGGAMRTKSGVEVAEYPDANGSAHKRHSKLTVRAWH
jgi:hypothetical protein